MTKENSGAKKQSSKKGFEKKENICSEKGVSESTARQ